MYRARRYKKIENFLEGEIPLTTLKNASAFVSRVHHCTTQVLEALRRWRLCARHHTCTLCVYAQRTCVVPCAKPPAAQSLQNLGGTVMHARDEGASVFEGGQWDFPLQKIFDFFVSSRAIQKMSPDKIIFRTFSNLETHLSEIWGDVSTYPPRPIVFATACMPL